MPFIAEYLLLLARDESARRKHFERPDATIDVIGLKDKVPANPEQAMLAFGLSLDQRNIVHEASREALSMRKGRDFDTARITLEEICGTRLTEAVQAELDAAYRDDNGATFKLRMCAKGIHK